MNLITTDQATFEQIIGDLNPSIEYSYQESTGTEWETWTYVVNGAAVGVVNRKDGGPFDYEVFGFYKPVKVGFSEVLALVTRADMIRNQG